MFDVIYVIDSMVKELKGKFVTIHSENGVFQGYVVSSFQNFLVIECLSCDLEDITQTFYVNYLMIENILVDEKDGWAYDRRSDVR